MAKGPWLWVGIVVVAVFLVLQYVVPRSGGDQISTSDLLKALNSNQLSKITFTDGDQQITAEVGGVTSPASFVTVQK